MISRIHSKLGTAGFVISILALVVALGGGAYAASGGLTGKQKKEVEKIAKKYAGKPGGPGAAGAGGPQGPAGTNGTNGKDGINGGKGEQGSPGSAGSAGAAGKSVTSSPVLPGDTACGGRGGAVYEIENVAASETEICNGSVGQDAGFNYTFNTNTAEADPGSGKLPDGCVFRTRWRSGVVGCWVAERDEIDARRRRGPSVYQRVQYPGK